MSSELVFTFVIAAVAVQRFFELRRSEQNVAELVQRGGEERGARETQWLRMLHAGWIAAMMIEVYYVGRPFLWALAAASAAVFAIGAALRFGSKHALREKWTVRIVTVRGEAPVTRGVYRWLRHPSYTGLALEIVALPLVHTAWLTALIFAGALAWLIPRLVRLEREALVEAGGYRAAADERAPLGTRVRIP